MKIRVQKEAWDAAKQQHPVCHRWYPCVLPLQHRSRTLLRPSAAQCHGKQEVFAEDICHLLIKHWEMPCWALLHVWTHSSCRMGWVSVVRLFSQHKAETFGFSPSSLTAKASHAQNPLLMQWLLRSPPGSLI